ncbi:MAG: hypothetical protein HOV80_15035 [Polyangiaceae bacterium]|nr:hypothetical protein [Polyangiaceae bacterium]
MRRVSRTLLLLSLTGACAPPGGQIGGGVQITAANVTGEPGSQILEVDGQIFIASNADSEGYLDGISLAVTDRGDTTSFDAPTLTTTGFPVTGRREATFHLEVPSPFSDVGTFDSFCSINARSVSVTAQLYIPQNDNDPDAPAPLTQLVGVFPLTPTGTAPSNDIFATSQPDAESSDSTEAPRPLELVPWEAGSLVFSTGDAEDHLSRSSVYEVTANGLITRLWTSSSLVETPRLAALDETLYFAGPSDNGGVIEVGQALTETGNLWTQIIEPRDYQDDENVIHTSALSAHAGGIRVAVQTSVAMKGLEGFTLEPPTGKYYGSFLYEYDPAGLLLSAQPSARDVISMTDLDDGGRIVATGELPPREEPPSVRIERLDPLGTPVFTHEEPGLAYHATTTPLSDGGILLSTEDRSLADTVVLVRLAADGTVVFRLRALGRGGFAAPRPDGSFLWTFTGTIAGLPKPTAGSVPNRAIPVLLEVTADGQIGRVKQLGCAGWTAVGGGRSSGSSLLVGSLDELSALGTVPVKTQRNQIFAVRVD